MSDLGLYYEFELEDMRQWIKKNMRIQYASKTRVNLCTKCNGPMGCGKTW
jgi:hypothetical protein